MFEARRPVKKIGGFWGLILYLKISAPKPTILLPEAPNNKTFPGRRQRKNRFAVQRHLEKSTSPIDVEWHGLFFWSPYVDMDWSHCDPHMWERKNWERIPYSVTSLSRCRVDNVVTSEQRRRDGTELRCTSLKTEEPSLHANRETVSRSFRSTWSDRTHWVSPESSSCTCCPALAIECRLCWGRLQDHWRSRCQQRWKMRCACRQSFPWSFGVLTRSPFRPLWWICGVHRVPKTETW